LLQSLYVPKNRLNVPQIRRTAVPKSDVIVRKALLSAVMDRAESIDHVEIKSITLGPAQRAGVHTHPCHVVGYIADGAIAFQIEGQPAKILKQGDAFHEPVNARMLRFDNASDSAPATFIAFYLLRPGEDRLIEMLQA
jgi:quercetin dioxygenase-like cupin family protein